MTPAPQTDDFPALADARRLWASSDLDAGLRAFDAAVAARPDNLKALLEAARALGDRFEVARATAYLDRASALSGPDPTLRSLTAASWSRVFRDDRAIADLTAIPDIGPLGRSELAAAYERTNRLDDALAQIDLCLGAAPDAAELHLARGRVLRRQGRDPAGAMAALRHALTLSRHPALVAEAWSEVSALHDRAGDAAQAVAAIDAAHGVLRADPAMPGLLARAAANNAAITRLAHDVRATTLARWQAAGGGPDTPCLAHLIGFPRSGTTLLEQRLDAHPGLVASPERVAFLRDALPALCAAGGGPLTRATLDAVPPSVLHRERTLYVARMQAALGEPIGARLHLDKNPNHTGVLPGLIRLFPGARLVVALRDPRDVVTSCVLRTFRPSEFSAMLMDWQSAADLYAVEMGAWLRYRDRLDPATYVETRYEDGLDAPEAEMRRVLAALDLPWDAGVRDYRDRIRTKVVNSPTQTEVRQPLYRTSVGRWRAYARWLAPCLPTLDPFIRAFGYD